MTKQNLENFRKKYEGLNCPMKSYKEAMQLECEKYRQEPEEITNWVDAAAEDYMSKEWDEEWKETGANYCEHCHRGIKEDDKNKRLEWAYERAWEDFNDQWACCVTDEECQNMGLEVKIEGYENNDGTIIPTEEIIEVCPYCEAEIWSKNNLPKENKEGELYCENCGTIIDGSEVNSELRQTCPILILKKI